VGMLVDVVMRMSVTCVFVVMPVSILVTVATATA